jgi:hypothetical protein
MYGLVFPDTYGNVSFLKKPIAKYTLVLEEVHHAGNIKTLYQGNDYVELQKIIAKSKGLVDGYWWNNMVLFEHGIRKMEWNNY